MSQLLPGKVRLHILRHAKMAPIHNAWMSGELARQGYRISPTMLHRVMNRMHGENLVIPDRQFVDGCIRRVYEITAHGIWALRRPEYVLALGEMKIDP